MTGEARSAHCGPETLKTEGRDEVVKENGRSISNIATLAQMETRDILWPKRGSCGLYPDDVGPVALRIY